MFKFLREFAQCMNEARHETDADRHAKWEAWDKMYPNRYKSQREREYFARKADPNWKPKEVKRLTSEQQLREWEKTSPNLQLLNPSSQLAILDNMAAVGAISGKTAAACGVPCSPDGRGHLVGANGLWRT